MNCTSCEVLRTTGPYIKQERWGADGLDQIQYMYCTWYSCNKLHDDRGASSQTNTVHASLPVQTYYCTTLVLYEG